MWVIIKWRNGLNITNMIDTRKPRPGQARQPSRVWETERGERDSHQIYFLWIIDVRNEISTSSSSFKYVMLQYFGFNPNPLRA